MRCPECDYPLWNLPTRECPECGRSFRPRNFDFRPNQVRFCCPKCDQTYYGTDARGHLVPDRFACVKCGTDLDMDTMILRPLTSEDETRGAMPWLIRRERGRIRSFAGTVGAAMVRPADLMRLVPANRGEGEAWWFAFLTIFIVTAITMLWMAPMFLAPALMVKTMASGGPSTAHVLGVLCGVLGVMFLLGVVSACLFLIVWGFFTHLLLALTGPTSYGVKRTFQALCYSSGANIISAVPCVNLFGWMWWVVSGVFMVKEAQRVSGLRASIAVATPPVVFSLAGVVAYGWLVYLSMAGGAMAAAGTSSLLARAETAQLMTGLNAYAVNHESQGPAHASMLIAAGHAASGAFVATEGRRPMDEMAVAETTLGEFTIMDRDEQEKVAQAAAAQLPDDVVAHRVGDFVFTYHGVDLVAGDPRLWIVVHAPPPESPDMTVLLLAGLIDGSTQPIPWFDRATSVAEQNAVRAEVGLPPLLDPLLVRNTPPGDDPTDTP